MGYWTFGAIVAASVISVGIVAACLVYCLCQQKKVGGRIGLMT
jgi:hypothetical protein